MSNHWDDDDEDDENRNLFGTISRVITPEDSNNGYWAVDVRCVNNARFKEVAYTGGIQFDGETGKPHGIWVPPKLGNTVIISFHDSNTDMPIMMQAIPVSLRRADVLNYERMKLLHQEFLKQDEVAVFHSSGTKIVLKETSILLIREDKKIEIDSTGVYAGKVGGTKNKVVSYEGLSAYLQTVVGNLGGPLFPTGLPASTRFDDFFGGV